MCRPTWLVTIAGVFARQPRQDAIALDFVPFVAALRSVNRQVQLV